MHLQSGLPFGLFKGKIYQIWPFLKLFAGNKMVLPVGHFFGLFNVDKTVYFRACFGQI